MVATHLPPERDFGPAVFPTMERGENGCRLFSNNTPQQMAWGFETLFSEVKSRDEHQLRNSIKAYLGGHSTYYRYHNGQRLLTPEQQEWIVRLFKQYGYTEKLVFDHYTYVYDLSH